MVDPAHFAAHLSIQRCYFGTEDARRSVGRLTHLDNPSQDVLQRAKRPSLVEAFLAAKPWEEISQCLREPASYRAAGDECPDRLSAPGRGGGQIRTAATVDPGVSREGTRLRSRVKESAAGMRQSF